VIPTQIRVGEPERPAASAPLAGSGPTGREVCETSRFGSVEVDAGSVLTFPDGLIGLPGARYALLCTDRRSPFYWLQSLEDARLALPVTDPHSFFRDFVVELDDEESRRLGYDGESAVDVLVTVTATAQSATVNLKAPILVREQQAHQVLNRAPGVQMKAPLPGVGVRAAQPGAVPRAAQPGVGANGRH
jgi:flagellar assembly factor FliW